MLRYNNLPGVNIDVKDGQMLLTQDNTANSVLIIGEVKSPSHVKVKDDAVLVQNENVLFENFGQYFYQGQVNPIAAEWFIARRAGIENIYLLGLNEATPKENFMKLHYLLDEVIADYQFSHVVVTNMYADEDIQGLIASDFDTDDITEVSGVEAYYVVRGAENVKAITLAESESETLTAGYGEEEISATLKPGSYSAKELVRELTAEFEIARRNIPGAPEVKVSIQDGKGVIQADSQVTLSGTEVLGALGISEETEIEFTFEGTGNPALLLGRYAEQQTAESEAMIVYIGTKPPKTTTKKDIRDMVDHLVERDNEYSKHVQVIAGPEVAVTLPNSTRTHWVSGVVQYATLVDSLAVQNATTNQPLPGASALRYDLSLNQLNRLVGNKYVTFRRKNNRIVVVDGVTTAPDILSEGDRKYHRSDFTRLSTLRSTNYMVGAVREAVEPFIGRPNEFPVYNAMNTAIKGAINRAVELGIIQDAIYSIELGSSMDASNVNLTILPQFELRQINVSIGLSTPAGFEALSN